MARYGYKCVNENCSECEVEVIITKPMMESDSEEYCEKCKYLLVRNYNGIGGIRTGDGFK